MKCFNHPTREAIYTAGYSFCTECSRKDDARVIMSWVKDEYSSMTIAEISFFSRKLFDGQDPCFSNFPILYKYLPRGEWSNTSRGFRIPQEEYFKKVLHVFFDMEVGANGNSEGSVMPRPGQW